MGTVARRENRGTAYRQGPGLWSREPQTRGYSVFGRVHEVFVLPQGGSLTQLDGTLTPLQPAPHTDPAVSCTNTLPQTTYYSRGPEGDDPEGNLHTTPQVPSPDPHSTPDQHRVVLGVRIPEGDNPGVVLAESVLVSVSVSVSVSNA